MSSNRRFGFALAAACTTVYALGLWYNAGHSAWIIAALALLIITLTLPRTLRPLKELWLKFGGLLHILLSPVLLGLFYFLGVTPIGLLMRVLGKDPLRLKRNRQSYWIERTPPGPDPQTMKEVF